MDCPHPKSSEACIASVLVSLYDKSVSVYSPSPRTAKVSVNGEARDASGKLSVDVSGCQVTVVKSNPWTFTITVPQMNLDMSITSGMGQYLSVTMAIDSQVGLLSLCLSVCLSLSLSLCLCLCVSLCVSLSVCLSVSLSLLLKDRLLGLDYTQG